MSDLEEREKASFVDPEKKAREDEERIKKKLAEEIARIRAMMEKKSQEVKKENWVVKVEWEGAIEEFGNVEDVVIKSSKKKGSALVVMGSKEDVAAATGVMVGDLSNPLLVLPLQPANPMPSVRAQEPVEREDASMGNVVGAGFQAFENSVLDKLKKAAQKQKAGKQET
ncbi:DnaJ-like protein subfamily C member 17 [Bienertia sinuspersici]